jgi:hypothetical protein
MTNEYSVVLVVKKRDGTQIEAPLSYESASSAVSSAADSKDNSLLFEALAEHPASQVREQVAYKDLISEKTISLLVKDSSVNVLRNLVRNESFRKYASHDQIIDLVSRDVEIAASVAQNLESYENVDHQALVEILLGSEDPYVIAAVAGNYATPKKFLKPLLNHIDRTVVHEAKRRLEN